MSGVQDSTAALKVWRRQTQATVGFPELWPMSVNTGRGSEGVPRTGEEMLVYPRKLDIGLHRIGDDKAVDDSLRDTL